MIFGLSDTSDLPFAVDSQGSHSFLNNFYISQVDYINNTLRLLHFHALFLSELVSTVFGSEWKNICISLYRLALD